MCWAEYNAHGIWLGLVLRGNWLPGINCGILKLALDMVVDELFICRLIKEFCLVITYVVHSEL